MPCTCSKATASPGRWAAEAIQDRHQPQPFALVRRLAPAGNERFWATHYASYVLDLYASNGRLLRRLRGDRDWFTIADRSTIEGRLNPLLQHVKLEEETGLLWLIFKVRDTRWKERAHWGKEAAPGIFSLESNTGDFLDLHDSIIEVVDPASGEILASLRSDPYISGFAGPGRVSIYHALPSGEPELRIYRVVLDRSSK